MALGLGSPVQYRAVGGAICAATVIGLDASAAPNRVNYFDYTMSRWLQSRPGLTRDDTQAVDNSYTVVTIT